MQIHELQAHFDHKKRRGRGGKSGTTCGRGTKGQNARAGRGLRPGFEGGRTPLNQSTPKLRGMGSEMGSLSRRSQRTVRIDVILPRLTKGDTITPEWLIEKGILHGEKSRYDLLVKIVGAKSACDISQPIVIQGCQVSGALRTAIEGAGGTVTPFEESSREPQEKKPNN